MALDTFIAAVMLAALIAYAVLGGADFGAGVWDLVSYGPRQAAHRRALEQAIGPVWEANHVWLIFVIVLLFTCFPLAYAQMSVALFWPLHLVLVGIVLRGTAFVFRAYGSTSAVSEAIWGRLFGASSVFTPLLLGMCLGSVSTGANDAVAVGAVWIGAFQLSTGILALFICAYLAAVYLAWESKEVALQNDFRTRAIFCWLAAGVASFATLVIARLEAPRLWSNLMSFPALALVSAGTLLAPLSLWALWRRHLGIARVFGAGQVGTLLLGWGVAQWPYLIYPDLTISAAAAPHATLSFIAATVPLGIAALVPSLWLLFSVFKGRNPSGEARQSSEASRR
jgi:cytochrome d ubiquinol oxidase subunit II